MKKKLLLLCAVVALSCFTACGSTDNNSGNDQGTGDMAATPRPGTVLDQGGANPTDNVSIVNPDVTISSDAGDEENSSGVIGEIGEDVGDAAEDLLDDARDGINDLTTPRGTNGTTNGVNATTNGTNGTSSTTSGTIGGNTGSAGNR